MARMARVVSEAIVLHYGQGELLRRLAHPFWFQSFGAVMGMDWHSSGITTSVMGALKRGLAPISGELGIHVCGGRGRHSRKTPAELLALGESTGLDAEALCHASRLVAKVDSAALQDHFELYLHSFVVSASGEWVVVQQGMNTERRQARRYHWLSEGLESFVDAPHAAIEGPHQGEIVNLTDRRAEASRRAQLELAREGPDRVVATLRRLREAPLPRAEAAPHLHLHMPAHHELRASDLLLRRLHGSLAAAAERGPLDFAELLMTPDLGARSVFALAVVSEVIHGAPCRFSDPGRFSTALGGKDGHPLPLPHHVYDENHSVLRVAVDRAQLGNEERLVAIRELDRQARVLEASSCGGPSFEAFVEGERRRSHALGGRTVHGPTRPLDADPPASRQRRSGGKHETPHARSGSQLSLPGFADP
jgi:hypothetical protein